MKQIKENKTMNNFYLIRSYFDIGMNVISYITGKIPMIAGIVMIASISFNYKIQGLDLAFWAIIGIFIALVVGFIYKKLGLYDLEMQKATLLNPVQQEIYEAAKRINKGEQK